MTSAFFLMSFSFVVDAARKTESETGKLAFWQVPEAVPGRGHVRVVLSGSTSTHAGRPALGQSRADFVHVSSVSLTRRMLMASYELDGCRLSLKHRWTYCSGLIQRLPLFTLSFR